MNTKVYMIMGVATDLGKAIALELAKTGEPVIMVARDPDRAALIEKEISAATQNPNLDMQLCDFSNLSSVRNLGTILLSRYDHIDALIHNIAVYAQKRKTTIDGFESMFAINYLGPFLLIHLLLERLRASGSARVVNIITPPKVDLNFDDLQGELSFNSLNAFDATKTANLLFTFELARRLQNDGVTVNAIHPGSVSSGGAKETFAPLRFLIELFAESPTRVAREIVQMATAPGYANLNGKFLYEGKEYDVPAFARDPGNQQRLWDISEQMTKAPEQGPNYDPTGSVAMFNDKDIPEGLIRPEDEQTETEKPEHKKR